MRILICLFKEEDRELFADDDHRNCNQDDPGFYSAQCSMLYCPLMLAHQKCSFQISDDDARRKNWKNDVLSVSEASLRPHPTVGCKKSKKAKKRAKQARKMHEEDEEEDADKVAT